VSDNKKEIILESPNLLLLDKVKILIFDSHKDFILALEGMVKNGQF
jgi:hypothetical protein